MFCPSCGKENADGANFCRFCGGKLSSGGAAASPAAPVQASPQPAVSTAPVSDPNEAVIPVAATPAVMQAAANAGNNTAEPKKKKGLPFKKREKAKAAPSAMPKPGKVPGAQTDFVTPGSALLASFIAAECLSYLIDSFLLLAKKTPLSMFTVLFFGIIGYAAAFGILVGASKLITGKAKAAPSLMFVGAIAAMRSAQSLITSIERSRAGIVRAIFIAAAYVIVIIAAAVIVKPLGRLFSQNDSCKQGGRLTAFLLILPALLVPSLFDQLKLIFSFTDTISFMSTFAYKLLLAAAEAALMAAAANRLLKKQKLSDQPAPAGGSPAGLIAGGAFAASSVVISVITILTYSVAFTAVYDVANQSIRGRVCMSGGDMTAAVSAFETAGEHSQAWLDLSGGESYSAPDKYSEDTVLMYLSYLNADRDRLRGYLVSSLNPEEIELWCPLMLEKYANTDNLSEDEEAHRKEMIELCIAAESFVNTYPTIEEIQKNGDDIKNALSSDTEFKKDLVIAKVFSSAQRGDSSTSALIDELMEASEEYPNDMNIQYAAAYIGSENRWDNASHFDKTAEAALRFRKLFNERYSESDPEKIRFNDEAVASMLINVQKYDEAERILEELVNSGSESKEIMQMLSMCYTEQNEKAKSDELSKKMYQEYPDDATVLRTYFLSELKGGNTKEAIEACSRLADLVKNDPKDGDVLLFNCVSYLTVRDSESWTDFQYNVYTEETSDEPRREIAKNEFLDVYCAAVYKDYQAREYEEALKEVDKALKIQENSGRLWYLKGLILYNLKRFDEAEKALLKADSLDPDDASTLYALANNYDALKRYEEAYEYCSRVVAKYPNGADHGEDWYGIAPHASSLMHSLSSYVKEGK